MTVFANDYQIWSENKKGLSMTISYMPVESCPKCGQIYNYFNTFSTHGKECQCCKWREEIGNYTGKEYKPFPNGTYTINVSGCVSCGL